MEDSILGVDTKGPNDKIPAANGTQQITSETGIRVRDIIKINLGREDKSAVTRNANLSNDLGASSLDAEDLIMDFEQEFDIKIPCEDAEKIGTVGDAITYIEKKLTEH